MFKNKCFLKNALEFNQLENKDMLYISNQRQLSTQEDFTAQKGSNWWMKLILCYGQHDPQELYYVTTNLMMMMMMTMKMMTTMTITMFDTNIL